MREARAFAPSHITGIFQIFNSSSNILRVGSRGAGVSLTSGVETVARVKKASRDYLQISINGIRSDSTEVSKHVTGIFLSRFKEMRNFKIEVEHDVKVPIGAGFGTSGAGALSLALALNEVFNLGLSRIEAAQLAHSAEVECKTGLGTVIAETFGGLEIRVKPGAPGIGEMKTVAVPEDVAVACLVFGPLSTKESLANETVRSRINELGGKLVDELVEEPSVANFMKLSRQFADHVGLMTPRMKTALDATDRAGFVCSMPMFGESLFTITKRGNLEQLLEIFHKHCPDQVTVVSEIDPKGARLLQ